MFSRVIKYLKQSIQKSRDAKLKEEVRLVVESINDQNLDAFLRGFNSIYPSLEIEAQSLEWFSSLNKRELNVLICEHNFAGNIDHYHHFFGAIFIPFVELCSLGYIGDKKTYYFPDCGPSLNREIIEVAEILEIHICFIPRQLTEILMSLDRFERLHFPSIDYCYDVGYLLKKCQSLNIQKFLFKALEVESPMGSSNDAPSIVVIDRAPPHEYYKSKKSNTGSSGAQRRSIPNIVDIVKRLSELGSVQKVYLEQMSLKEKLALFNSAEIIVAQMGAGLNGMLWCQPNATLIEIHPNCERLYRDYSAFGNIAESLEMNHYRIIQDSPHASVDPELVYCFVKHAIRTKRQSR